MVSKDLDIARAKNILFHKHGKVSNLHFGKVRRDGTRGVTFLHPKHGKLSYSYLTDIN